MTYLTKPKWGTNFKKTENREKLQSERRLTELFALVKVMIQKKKEEKMKKNRKEKSNGIGGNGLQKSWRFKRNKAFIVFKRSDAFIRIVADRFELDSECRKRKLKETLFFIHDRYEHEKLDLSNI